MTSALKPYFARSAALHGAALAAFALVASRGGLKANKVYMIDFVGGSTLQSAAPRSAGAARGEPEPSRPAPQADSEAIAPKGAKSVALPRPSLLKGWSEPKAPPRPSLAAEAPAAPAAGAGAGPASAGGSAGVSTDLPNFPYPWYISQIRLMLWQAWQKRMPAYPGEGTTVFAILRNGGVTDLRMESSSGDAAFDQAALESVQAAAPFPALPSDFPEPFLKIHLALRSESSWR